MWAKLLAALPHLLTVLFTAMTTIRGSQLQSMDVDAGPVSWLTSLGPWAVGLLGSLGVGVWRSGKPVASIAPPDPVFGVMAESARAKGAQGDTAGMRIMADAIDVAKKASVP